jgi:hypothetical protein
MRIATHTPDELVICCPSSARWLGRAAMGAGGLLILLALGAILGALLGGSKPDTSWIGAGVIGSAGLLFFAAGVSSARQAQDLVFHFDGQAGCLRVEGPKVAERRIPLADIIGAQVYEGGDDVYLVQLCLRSGSKPLDLADVLSSGRDSKTALAKTINDFLEAHRDNGRSG